MKYAKVKILLNVSFYSCNLYEITKNGIDKGKIVGCEVFMQWRGKRKIMVTKGSLSYLYGRRVLCLKVLVVT